MMRATERDVLDVWRTPWSKPLRAACQEMGDHQPIEGVPLKNAVSPWWVRPFFLHLWVAQAIVARWAWLKEHPGAVKERFGEESVTDWLHVTWAFAERWVLRELTLEKLREHLFWEVERVQLILEESPWMVGGGEWAQALLVGCGNVAMYYAELRRRQGTAWAREQVQEVLAGYVVWQPEPEQAGGDEQTLEGGTSAEGEG